MTVEISVTYRTLDMLLSIPYYSLSDGEVEVIDFTITLDGGISEEHPHPTDDIARMVIGMLSDGTHLEDKILEYLMYDEDTYYNIYEACTKDAYEEHQANIDMEADYRYDLWKDEGIR